MFTSEVIGSRQSDHIHGKMKSHPALATVAMKMNSCG
jgi:hypothetical protein